MAIKIEMLRCFEAVARSGNLADAASKLGRTPSAVSMTLRQLEDMLGSHLFEAGRKNKLTALGRHVLAESTRGLEHFKHTTRAIETYARSETGLVRVAAVPSVAAAILPRIVQSFAADHPGVQVEVRDMDSLSVIRELERERVDLGIATGRSTGGDVETEEIFSDPFGIVCRSNHELADPDGGASWDDLAAWPFIANSLCSHITSTSFQATFANSKLTVHNATSILAMVKAGLGVTVLPRLAVDDTDPDLAFVPITDHAERRSIDILRRARSSLSPAAKKFEHTVRRVSTNLGS
ncbi:MAG: LysR family transcriptional regulator [Alphaproteobacteria bacterium]|nr:LysR family transcriptional regulator [Alphaproteobacteria bacterium]